MLGYLTPRTAEGARVEIPFTRGHWEAYFVATHIPIARGWERQSDLQLNSELYHPLSAAGYRRWLDANGVSYVALPDVVLDQGGRAEATLLAHAPAYLQPVWHDQHWRVWRVRDATGLVTGPARLVDLDPTTLTLLFRTPGSAEVRVRGGHLWKSDSAGVCITSDASGWLVVRAASAGVVHVDSRLHGAAWSATAGGGCPS